MYIMAVIVTESAVVVILQFNEIRLHGKSFSNLFKYLPHRHACITILLGLNQQTAFAMLQSKLITVESRIYKSHNS